MNNVEVIVNFSLLYLVQSGKLKNLWGLLFQSADLVIETKNMLKRGCTNVVSVAF